MQHLQLGRKENLFFFYNSQDVLTGLFFVVLHELSFFLSHILSYVAQNPWSVEFGYSKSFDGAEAWRVESRDPLEIKACAEI